MGDEAANKTMGYLKNLYNSTMAMADPMAGDYPLMGSPQNALMLVGLYVLVCVQGPKWMDGVKPLQFKKTIAAYNFAMSLFNLYIFVNVSSGLLRKGYSIKCEQIHTYRNQPDERMWLNVGWLFVLSKFVEFFDTVFFILSNKISHVTFLHCYHHAVMACFTWLGYKFMPGGTNTIYTLLNSFVHVVMYIYYGMAAMGPGMRKYLWWKKYLTIVQMSQFLIFLTQGAINVYYDCPSPAVFKYSVYVFTLSILILFINFYIKAYFSKKSTPVSNGKKSH